MVALELQSRMTHSVFIHEQRTEPVAHGLRIVDRGSSVDDNVRCHAHNTRPNRPKVDVVDGVDIRFSNKHLDDLGHREPSRHAVEEHACRRHDESPRAPQHSSGQQQRRRRVNPRRAADCQQPTGDDNDHRASKIGQQVQPSGAQRDVIVVVIVADK